MDFSWTDEQIALREQMAEAARREVPGDIADRDREGRFDRDLWDRIAATGILGLNVPAEHGGQGLDVLTTVIALEGLGYGCQDNGLTLAINGQIWTVQEPIASFGSEVQQRRYLPRLASGELIGAQAMTEPRSGSDSYAMETVAQRSGDGFVLNGTKTLIGMATVCDLALVFAKTDPEKGRWGISAFLVDMSTPGIEVSAAMPKMGLRTNPTGEITFLDAWVPEGSMLGPPGAGLSISADSFEWERSLIFASHVGSMERQLEQVIEHARTREQFGRPIGAFQSVSNRVADMKLRLETAKLFLYHAAWLKSTGQPSALDSALTKLVISEAFVASSLDAIRIHGGVGYLSDAGVERDLRDAVGGVIYGGTSEIQRQVVSRLLGL